MPLVLLQVFAISLWCGVCKGLSSEPLRQAQLVPRVWAPADTVLAAQDMKKILSRMIRMNVGTMSEYLPSSENPCITGRIRAFLRSCQIGTFGSAVYGTSNIGFKVFRHKRYLL